MNLRLVSVAILSSMATSAYYYLSERNSKKKAIKEYKKEVAEFEPLNKNELLKEQLSRNISFLGADGVDRLQNSFVIVVGLGGVGSHAAHMLARSGIGRLRLIDFDQVTLSSLNRHAVATRADVGQSKASVLSHHLHQINPHIQIDIQTCLFDMEHAQELLKGSPDFVLDCIDNLETKVDLLVYCKKNGLSVISSMGAGAKSDPSRIQLSDISETFEDPLARRTRKALRAKGIHGGIPVVYSLEKPGQVQLVPLDESKVEEADQYAALPNFRSRILPVLGPIPALFGMTMACHVMTELANFPTEPLPFKGRTKLYQKMLFDLTRKQKVPFNIDDVAFLYEEVWRGRSSISQVANEKLMLVHFDSKKPISITNTICLTKVEAEKHANLTEDEFDTFYKPFISYIQQRFQMAKEWDKYR